MKIPKMKVLAEAGAVRSVEAMPEADGWAVWVIYTSHGNERREPLERQRGGVRVFATLEAVVHTVIAAGLTGFQVNTAKLP
ncbi:MAG: hypothetical protein ABTQ25_04920 [Nitrosomonas ureae]